MSTLSTSSQEILKIHCKELVMAESKVLTYPTRLAAAWSPSVLEIKTGIQRKEAYDLGVTIYRGSTRSLGIVCRNPVKRIIKHFASPIHVSDGYIYDFRYDTDENIAHIINGFALYVLAIRRYCPELSNLTIILRANPSKLAQEICRLLKVPTLCTDREVTGQMIRLSLWEGYPGESLFTSLYGQFDFEGYSSQTPERVFISRKGKRRLINEHEVEQVLQEYGFEKVYFEDIPISQQWSIGKNAKAVVGIHGAALSSLAFNCHKVKLLELFHPGYVVDMYRWVANAVDGTWCGVSGQITKEVIPELDYHQKARSLALKPTKIDLDSLRMGLDYLGIDKGIEERLEAKG